MMNYMDLLLTQAGKLPQKVFLVTETKRLTYEAVCDAALSYAALLQSLSCPKGTLLIVRKDPVAQLTAFLGAQKAGFVPIYFRSSGPDASSSGNTVQKAGHCLY